MVRTYANVEEIFTITKDVENFLGELGETPFELLKEEQEEGMHDDTLLEKQMFALNESFINFFKGISSVDGTIPLRVNNSTMCQICKTNDQITITCLHIGNLKPKCARYSLSTHKTKNHGVNCGYCSNVGHREDRCWKRGKDEKTLDLLPTTIWRS
jgi:hypothetical protein